MRPKKDSLFKSCKTKVLLRKCHVCGEVIESVVEPKKCPSCHKSFLPLNYFSKTGANGKTDFDNLFSETDELFEEDLIRGLYVLW